MQKASFRNFALPLCLSLFLLPAFASAQDADLLGDDVQALDSDALFGHLRSPNRAEISSEISSKITLIPFRDGNAFHKGDVLVEFDCTELEAQKAKVTAILDGALKQYQAEKRLLKLQSGGQLELDLAAAKVAEGRADLRGVQAKLDKCTLYAPYDGKIVEQKANEHEFVQIGEPIVEIVEQSAMEVEFIVPSLWVSKLNIGTIFNFEIGETQTSYRAKIIRQGAIIDPISRTVTMIGQLDQIHDELIVGMSGFVKLQGVE